MQEIAEHNVTEARRQANNYLRERSSRRVTVINSRQKTPELYRDFSKKTALAPSRFSSKTVDPVLKKAPKSKNHFTIDKAYSIALEKDV
jgi:hypothetical protein